ncbi:hypothetical protein V9N52_004113, partial [Vibrio navarrensis]
DVILDNCLSEFERDSSIKGIAFNIKEFNTETHNRFEIPHKNKNINLDEDFNTYLMIGAGHALDVKAVKEVGNYPDDFGLYGFEEIDLSFRLINAGYKIRYLCRCVILHKKSPDGRFSSAFVNKLAFVNRCKMAKRYFSIFNFIKCYLVRGAFFIIKNRNPKMFYMASREIFSDRKKMKFNRHFYDYIKSVDGFIGW